MSSDSSGISGMSGVSGMNTMQTAMDTKAAKQEFGAGVVKTTLDYMNSGSFGGSGKNSDYDFQTKVLEGGFMAKGTMVSGKV
ncbi:hypothetical protein [Fundidesulfovibrio terrae]|uniref:hypothetical protein n=1 Tax=Fundidesulfovibrio terrae TaxID=2922866 RepID=UPI001FAF4717|nr:hypothetical protein [Fundidesulfovibrio terrae]